MFALSDLLFSLPADPDKQKYKSLLKYFVNATTIDLIIASKNSRIKDRDLIFPHNCTLFNIRWKIVIQHAIHEISFLLFLFLELKLSSGAAGFQLSNANFMAASTLRTSLEVRAF